MPNQILAASRIGLRQGEPPEGRAGIVLPSLVFTTGSEVYEWDSTSLGVKPISGIYSAWFNIGNLPSADNLIVNTGVQSIVINGAAGSGYMILTAPAPTKFLFSSNVGSWATGEIILYNYNVFLTGVKGSDSNPAANQSNARSGLIVQKGLRIIR